MKTKNTKYETIEIVKYHLIFLSEKLKAYIYPLPNLLGKVPLFVYKISWESFSNLFQIKCSTSFKLIFMITVFLFHACLRYLGIFFFRLSIFWASWVLKGLKFWSVGFVSDWVPDFLIFSSWIMGRTRPSVSLVFLVSSLLVSSSPFSKTSTFFSAS